MHDYYDASRPALLRACVEASADAAPKLIYADWLDESGDEADAKLARTLRWMAAFWKWPYLVRHSIPVRSSGNKGPEWEAFWRTPDSYEWSDASCLSFRIARNLRPDGSIKLGPSPLGTSYCPDGGLIYSAGLGANRETAVALAIECLSNALTDEDFAEATRILLAPARA